mgnify:CR=1 FL=1
MNEVLRDEYVKDNEKGIEYFNRICEKAGIDFRFKLPNRRFNRRIGIYSEARFDLDGNGVVGQYIHMQGKVGVLIELNTSSPELASNEAFRDLVKDITLHIAAASPICISRDEVPQATIDKEREIYADQVKGKPENIIEKILGGKLDKFFSTVCLMEQGFIKDTDQSIGDLLKAKGAELGGEIKVSRFVRFAIGEEL